MGPICFDGSTFQCDYCDMRILQLAVVKSKIQTQHPIISESLKLKVDIKHKTTIFMCVYCWLYWL